MSTKIQNIYNQNAKKYKHETQDFSFPEWMFDFFISELAGKKVLDLWCAYWRDVLRLRNLWFEAYGVDVSSWLINQAEHKVKKHLKLGDIRDITSHHKKSSYDGIISSASIVHMDHADWLSVINQAYWLLRESGILFLSLKVSSSKKTIKKESISIPWVIKTYIYHGEKEIDINLEKIWFSILKTHIWKPKDDQWKIIVAKK